MVAVGTLRSANLIKVGKTLLTRTVNYAADYTEQSADEQPRNAKGGGGGKNRGMEGDRQMDKRNG